MLRSASAAQIAPRRAPRRGLSARRVAVQPSLAPGLAELRRGIAQDDVDSRIVGPHEGGEQLRRAPAATPMRRRQETDLRHVPCALAPRLVQNRRQFQAARLREAGEQGGIETEIGSLDVMVRAGRNPLGCRALYLYQGDRDTLYRIHGTNEPWTVGGTDSSGCIRLLNEDIYDLYGRVPLGTTVIVKTSVSEVMVQREWDERPRSENQALLFR